MVWWGERNGLTRISPFPPFNRPQALYTRVTSRLSSPVRGGRMVGMRLAIIVFPAPGLPTIKRLCIPAAAISAARFAPSCAFTSQKSMEYSPERSSHPPPVRALAFPFRGSLI